MTDIAQLGIEVKTGDVSRARKELDALTAAGGRAERSADHLARTSEGLGRVMRGVVAGLGVRELIKLSDAHTKYTAQLRLATKSELEFAYAQEQVRRISRAAQADLADTGTLYARISKSTAQLGVSQAKVSDITEVVALSLKASGASAEESGSAILQLSQAFASGVLRGEEFNAVNEAAPRLMQALADGLGKPVGALRQMAADGKLTSKVLADVLPQALADVRKEAAQIQTISGSFTVLRNNLIEFVGTQGKASGAVKVLSGGIETLANNLDLLAAAALGVGSAKLAHVLLTTAVAAKDGAAGALAHVSALQAERAASLAMTQAAAQQATATAATAQADLAASRAKITNLQTTQAAIVAARADVAAKMAQTQATMAQATAQINAARAAGAQSAALAAVRQGTDALAAAQIRQAALVRELAILGQQQARVQAATTAAMTAQTTAAGAATAATTAAAAAQTGLATATARSGVALTASRAVLGALGGPIGLITTLLGVGATAWILYGNRSKEAADQAAESVRRIRESLGGNLADLNKIDALIRQSAAAGYGADSARIQALQARRDALQSQISAERKELDGIAAERERNDAIGRHELARRVDPQAILNRQKAALAAFLESNQTKAEKFAAAIAKAKSEMGSLFNADIEKRIRSDIFGDKQAKPDTSLLDALKIEASQEAGVFQSRNAALAAYHSAALINDQAFYAGKEAAREDYIATLSRQFQAEKALLEAQVATSPSDKRAEAQKALKEATAEYHEALRGIAETRASEEIERIGRATQAVFEASQKSNQTAIDSLANLVAGNQAMREEIELLGATEEAKTAVEKARVRSIRTLKEEQLAHLEAGNVAEAQLLQLQREIDLLKERERLIELRGATASGVALRDSATKAGDTYRSSLADSIEAGILEGSRRGLDLMEIFRNELKAQFARTVLRPIIQPIADSTNSLIGQLVSSVASAYFGGGMSFTGGGFGGDSIWQGGSSMPDSIRGGRAKGGPVQAGGMYEVTEEGPELFKSRGRTYLMSDDGGMVEPASFAKPAPAGGGAPVFNLKIETNGQQQPEVSRRRNQTGGEDVLIKFREAIKDDLSSDMANGGRFGKAMENTMGTSRAPQLMR